MNDESFLHSCAALVGYIGAVVAGVTLVCSIADLIK